MKQVLQNTGVLKSSPLKTRGIYVILMVLMITIVIINLDAAWFDDMPVTLKQPDGTIIRALQTGDEFHNWAHDRNGYTIVRDPNTGYWSWARESLSNIGASIENKGRTKEQERKEACM